MQTEKEFKETLDRLSEPSKKILSRKERRKLKRNKNKKYGTK